MVFLALAAALPLSAPVADAPTYATVREAMDAAAHAMLAVSKTNEAASAIYQTGDGERYAFTRVVTQNAASEIDYRVALYPQQRLVALCHTHPGNTGAADALSPDDRAIVRAMGVPMFIVAVTLKHVVASDRRLPDYFLDVVPVEYPTLTIGGKVYRVLSETGGYYLLEREDRKFFLKKTAKLFPTACESCEPNRR